MSGTLGPGEAETFLNYLDVPDDYPEWGQLAHDVQEAFWEAGMDVVRDRMATDPVLRAMMDDRYRTWEAHPMQLGSVPAGTEITFHGGGLPRQATGVVRARPARDIAAGEWVPVDWFQRPNGYQPNLRRTTLVEARLPIPFDLSALILTLSQEAAAAPTAVGPPRRPWRRGTLPK